YAIGVVLFEMLTGELPFDGETTVEVYHKIMQELAPVPSMMNGTIDEDIDRIVVKAMAKERGDRYPTALALADDIRRRLDGNPVQARPPSLLTMVRRRAIKAGPFVAAFAATLLLIGAVIFLVSTLHERRTERGRVKAADHEVAMVEDLLRTQRSEGEASLRNALVLLSEGQSGKAEHLCETAIRKLTDHEARLNELEYGDKNRDRVAAFLTRFAAEECRELLRDLELALGRARAHGGGAEADRRALSAFQRALELDPMAVEVHLARGRFFSDRDRLGEATAAYDEALRVDPDNGDALLERGLAQERLGYWYEAVDGYRRLVDLEVDRAGGRIDQTALRPPNQGVSLLLKGMLRVAVCEMRLERPELAVEKLNELIAADPGYPPAFVLRSEAHLLMGQADLARRAARAALESEGVPELAFEGLYAEARVDLAQGDIEAAIKSLNAVILREPDHVPSQLLLGVALERDGQREAARAAYENAVAIESKDYRSELAVAAVRLGDLQRGYNTARSVGAFDRALRIDALQPAALLGRARAQLRLGQLDAAYKDAQQAARLGAPGHTTLPVLGAVELRRGNAKEAGRLFRQAAEGAPGGFHPEAAAGLGDALRLLGDEAGGLEAHRSSLEQEHQTVRLSPMELLGQTRDGLRPRWDPAVGSMRPDIEAALTYRRARARRQSEDAAREAGEAVILGFERAAKWCPRFVHARLSLAAIYLRRKSYDLALQYCSEAIEGNAAFASALALRGQVRLEQEHLDEALEDLDLALSLSSRRGDIWLLRARVLMHKQRHEEALDAAQRAARYLAVQSQHRGARTAEAYELIAKLLRRTGRDDLAASYEAQAQRALNANHKEAEQHVERGVALYEEGKFKAAIGEFDRAIAVEAGHARAWHLKALAQPQGPGPVRARQPRAGGALLCPRDRVGFDLRGQPACLASTGDRADGVRPRSGPGRSRGPAKVRTSRSNGGLSARRAPRRDQLPRGQAARDKEPRAFGGAAVRGAGRRPRPSGRADRARLRERAAREEGRGRVRSRQGGATRRAQLLRPVHDRGDLDAHGAARRRARQASAGRRSRIRGSRQARRREALPAVARPGRVHRSPRDHAQVAAHVVR
ncbi:MAG: tetratricopeptide repeat protein, partial [Planctomycetota bacterium]